MARLQVTVEGSDSGKITKPGDRLALIEGFRLKQAV